MLHDLEQYTKSIGDKTHSLELVCIKKKKNQKKSRDLFSCELNIVN